MKAQPLIEQLEAFQPFDAREAEHLERTLAFLKNTEQPFHRTTQAGHITGSAIVTNGHRTLFIWHAKLERWLQPGGHCEPDIDAHVEATARRELIEETGITAVKLAALRPFDIDVHLIPHPPHPHYDIRFWYEVPEDANATAEIRWVDLETVAQDADESRARFARKLLAQNVGGSGL